MDGNLWVGWGMGEEGQDGVSVFDPVGQADRPHRPARAVRQPLLRRRCHRNRLFMCASTSLYSLYVNTQGAAFG